MAYVTDADLNDARRSQEALFDTTCSVTLPGTTRTADGGVTETSTTIYSALACSLRRMTGGDEALRGDAVQPVPRYQWKAAYSAAVNEKHRIVIGGVTWNVLSTNNSESRRTATVAEVTPIKARPL